MGTPTVDQVRKKLQSVIDPEVGLSVVDMGLIYGVSISDDGIVDVRLTLTTRGCPMGDYISSGVLAAARSLDGVRDARVDLVWEPQWSPNMINQEALEALRAGRYQAEGMNS